MKFNYLNDTDFTNNMNNSDTKEILELYNIYRELFTEYVIDKLDLIKYDEKIKKSELNFIPIKLNKMDIYQYFSKDVLKYFYIRNDIYVNKLTEEEKSFLIKKKNNNNYNLDEKTKKIIEDSYKRVIYYGENKKNEKINIFYGPLSIQFSAPIENIVIGVRYDEFNTNGLTDDEWENLYNSQNEYLYKIMEEIENKSKEISVIRYDEFSIIPKKNK